MMSRGTASVVAIAIALLLVSGCAAARGSADEPVELEFFQFKAEAIGTFDRLVEEFNAQNPDIKVEHNPVPDADTAIRVRMVREDVPDVIALNGNFTFGELAQAGVFYDFAGEPIVEKVSPAILKILNDLGTYEHGEVNGIPFVNNADGVIYNKDLFEEHGVEPPTTWDEMIGVIETFEAAGVLPFYATLQDSWTSLPAWNALASNLPPDDFFPMLREGQASFQQHHDEVATRLKTLFSYAQDTKFERTYDAGNQAFAQGEAAMYLQGVWAIPTIRSFEPDFEIGTFAYPVDEPNSADLTSGVDVALTMGRNPEHPEEALRFIEFLMTPEIMAAYAEEQSAIPTLEGVTTEDPALEGFVPYFDEGRLTGFADHQIPPSIPLTAINQSFLISGNKEAYLQELDEEWDKVARRQL